MITTKNILLENNDMYFDNLSCGDCKRCIIGKEGYPVCEETGERVHPKFYKACKRYFLGFGDNSISQLGWFHEI